jgi:hypothetical protein
MKIEIKNTKILFLFVSKEKKKEKELQYNRGTAMGADRSWSTRREEN